MGELKVSFAIEWRALPELAASEDEAAEAAEAAGAEAADVEIAAAVADDDAAPADVADGPAEGVRELIIYEDGMATPADLAREMGVSVRRVVAEGIESRYLTITPRVPGEVVYVRAFVTGWDLLGADTLFLNGYNSWTDSVERPPQAWMRGLAGVPTRLVDRWVLDNSGDYRFVEQDARPGRQHGFGYGYVRHESRVQLVGSLDEDEGFTLLYEDLLADEICLEKESPKGVLPAGETRQLMAFALASGKRDDAVALWCARAGYTARPAAPLVGYSSWYRHYTHISQSKLEHDLDGVAQLYEGRDLGACVSIFQVDDGWTHVGDWTTPDPARFPDGMAAMAAKIRERGLLPGLWMAPFICETNSYLYSQHQDWLLRDEQGELVRAGGNWSGAWALDLSVPEARAYVAECLRTATEDWGFRMLKLDFLYAACLKTTSDMNRAQRMADALDLLRASVPEGVAFDLCGVPLMSAFGRTEYCRIGCDVGLDWDDRPHMRLLHRERVSTKNSLANTRGRAHLDGLVFRNDPDVFFLRDDVKLSSEQKAELLWADAMLGGMFLTSDDAALWGQSELLDFDEALSAFVERSKRG
jgi:alpha-galactosidase